MQTESKDRVFAEAREAFVSRRGLAFTVEWRRFPWTKGAEVDRALVGPAYLGNVALGLRGGDHWGYQRRNGEWVFVPHSRLDVLISAVVDEFAGFVPPLAHRGSGAEARR